MAFLGEEVGEERGGGWSARSVLIPKQVLGSRETCHAGYLSGNASNLHNPLRASF